MDQKTDIKNHKLADSLQVYSMRIYFLSLPLTALIYQSRITETKFFSSISDSLYLSIYFISIMSFIVFIGSTILMTLVSRKVGLLFKEKDIPAPRWNYIVVVFIIYNILWLLSGVLDIYIQIFISVFVIIFSELTAKHNNQLFKKLYHEFNTYK